MKTIEKISRAVGIATEKLIAKYQLPITEARQFWLDEYNEVLNKLNEAEEKV